jgi:histone deacetylase 11
MVPLVYSPHYNITAFGLERLHPFDSLKYRRIRDWLVGQGLRKPGDFISPRPCKHGDLVRVHAPAYLRSLRDRRVLARILEVPIIGRLPGWLTAWQPALVTKRGRWFGRVRRDRTHDGPEFVDHERPRL